MQGLSPLPRVGCFAAAGERGDAGSNRDRQWPGGPLCRRHLRDPFLLHWVEMLCFLISGREPDQTSAAAMVSLFGEWLEPDAGWPTR